MGLLIYRSSAGSGKTFTLVKLYLKKVLHSPSLYRNILAITFTNKATEEMKTRIIKELDILAKGLVSNYEDFLIKELKFDKDTLSERASEVLKRILHDYSSFAISTIDSYFQVLSRTLAKELNLPVKYEIELDSQSICKAITDQLLADVGRVSITTQWLSGLLLDRLENNKNWNIRPDLNKITGQLLFRDDARELALSADPEKVMQLIIKLKKIRTEVEGNMRSMGSSATAAIKQAGFDVDTFSYKAVGPAGYFYRISSTRSGYKEFIYGSRIQAAVENPSKFLTKENQKNTIIIDLVNQELHPLLCQIVDYYEENKKEYLSAFESLKLIYLAGISGSLNKKLIDFRDEFQLFLLSDTTRILREIVKENDAPFIYEKTGNLYRHLFIDEFQDTSTEQWEILKPLVANSIGSGNDVLLVGDAKQSIYRWRGGNMHLLLEGAQHELRRFRELIKQDQLNTNYRSLGNIVNFNNTFFVNAGTFAGQLESSDPDVFSKAYSIEGVHQAFKDGRENKGTIEFSFFDSPKKKQNSYSVSNDESDEEDNHWIPKALARLDNLLQEFQDRNIPLRNIAILVRTNAHEQIIADHLYKSNKYAFISGNSLLLSANPTCLFLLNCFKILLDDKEALLHLEINNFVLSDQYTPAVNEIPFLKSETLNSKNSYSKNVLLKQRDYLLSLPVDLAYLKILELADLIKPDSFIDKFSDLVMEFTGKQGTGIKEFLEWWDDQNESKKWSIEIPENTDAIRLLSIHRSKGLQFPIVMIPLLDWSIVPSYKDVLWAKTENAPFNDLTKLPVSPTKNLAETLFADDYIQECKETYLDNLNLLYVAFTRAENQLHVFGNKSSSRSNVGSFVLNTLREIPEYAAQLLENENIQLVIGDPNSIPQQKSEVAFQEKQSLYFPQSIIAIAPSYSENIKATIPSLQTHFESAQILFGKQIHEVLNRMRSKSDQQQAIHKIAVKYGILNKNDQLEEVSKTVSQVWELMTEKGWTNSTLSVESEPEICDESGQSHRPDRVLIDGKKAIVLDFKTGQESDKHHEQVQLYCQLLEKAGYNPIEGHLIYTSLGKTENVKTTF